MEIPQDRNKEGRFVFVGLSAWFFLQFVVIFNFNGTFDAGDSVMHYLFSRHAWAHPENYLDQWAKPVFTLLSSPFAAFGWLGMKLFQCLLAVCTSWFGYRIATKLGLQHAWAVPFFILFAPDFFLAQFSGLTEPLFAAMLMGGIWAIVSGKREVGALLLSFLPFVRTEGFLLLAGFGLVLLLEKHWKAVVGLGLGTVVFGLIGWAFSGDPAWVFNQNPYNKGIDNYGSGTWGHFFVQYQYVVGIPVFVLTIFGFAGGLLRIVAEKGKQAMNRLIYGYVWLPFLIYFLAHVLFWATGTGHSLGMSRVMIAIIPLGALIIIDGLNGIMGIAKLSGFVSRIVMVVVVLTVAVFPWLPNPAALQLPRDLKLTPDQELAKGAAEWLKSQGPLPQPVYVSHPSFAMFAGIDPFDSTQKQNLQPLGLGVPKGSVMVWDSWFSQMEDGVVPGFWDEFPGKYELLWKQDTVVGHASSEFRVYRKAID